MAENKSDRKPNAARTFSADLNDAFMIDSNLAGLAQSVEQKKQAVSSQSQELEALEARIRETEERLKQKQSKISGQPGMGGTQVSSQRQELEALEARIRETEERLKQKQSMISAQPGVGGTQNSPHGREPSGTTFGTYQDKNPPAALPNPRGPQSPASQAQQPLVQGQPAG
ncbi:MAG: hypothetical protein FRX48_01789 [Lasallia pustulata]|uniref:Uncharacterized protein n=1 Tax=Lasallia pustulata TaxID=136370 RepID=A0A5M8Q1I8_9LECA|nr:MAG: hypothetical protein FRX48_01789 [Lasallia pustulata]